MKSQLPPDHDDDDAPTGSQTARELADAGNAEAQFIVGVRCAQAGTEGDFVAAAEWYRKASEQNHGLAQFNLGIMYLKGQGVARDQKSAMMWMTRAAQGGDAGAQYELGMRQHRHSLDLIGTDAMELRIEAYKWLRLSSAQGYADSERGSASVALDMDHAAVTEARRRAEIFVALPGTAAGSN
jgi:TPR repeat protein